MRSHQDWFDSQIIFLKIISMQPLRFSFLPPRLNFLEKILNLLFGLFWHFIVIHLGIFQTVTIILNLDKTLDEIMDYVLIGSIYIYGYSILCFYQYNWEKLLKLVDFVNQNFHHRSAKGLTFVSINATVKASKKFVFAWLFACLGGTMSWIIYPLIQCASCKILPLKSWYPFDVVSSPNYEIAFILQVFGQIFVGIGYGICGGTYMSFVFMLCGQFDILYASLKNLTKSAASGDSKGMELFRERQKQFQVEEQEVNQYFLSEEQLDSAQEGNEVAPLMKDLIDCIKHHQMILEFGKKLEDYFRWFLFPKLFYSAFLVCIVAYVLSTMEEFSIIRISNLLMYFALSTSELLLFTYVAEILKHHSSRVGEALMRSNYETFDNPVQRSTIIILINALKPVEQTAGKIYKVNIEQFRTVMGTAFSYYTLLKNLKENDKK